MIFSVATPRTVLVEARFSEFPAVIATLTRLNENEPHPVYPAYPGLTISSRNSGGLQPARYIEAEQASAYTVSL